MTEPNTPELVIAVVEMKDLAPVYTRAMQNGKDTLIIVSDSHWRLRINPEFVARFEKMCGRSPEKQ